MNCIIHKDIEAKAMCVKCGQLFCDDCLVTLNDKNYCENCYLKNELVTEKTNVQVKSGGILPTIAVVLSSILSIYSMYFFARDLLNGYLINRFTYSPFSVIFDIIPFIMLTLSVVLMTGSVKNTSFIKVLAIIMFLICIYSDFSFITSPYLSQIEFFILLRTFLRDFIRIISLILIFVSSNIKSKQTQI